LQQFGRKIPPGARGSISGTPTATSAAPVIFEVQDSSSPVLTQTATLPMTVNGALAVTTSSLLAAEVGVACEFVCTFLHGHRQQCPRATQVREPRVDRGATQRCHFHFHHASGRVGDGSTTTTFSARQENQRAGLALINGTVYVAWASHEDTLPYYGWLMGYTYGAASGFTQVSVLNVTPNSATPSAAFTVSQYFTPEDQVSASGEPQADQDFGSGGAAVLANVTSGIDDAVPVRSTSAGRRSGELRISRPFSCDLGDRDHERCRLGPRQQPVLAPTNRKAADRRCCNAYDATSLAELWTSSMAAGGADAAGNAVKFTVPSIANGKVYVGTRGNNTGGALNSPSVAGELDVYGQQPN
jgi:hypothetical protein